ncbi:hypothetical protein TNCV_465811 [Trichonephila clavipes]|nr:hypothetical protein TNCV_465811 [Trichonephila clavipes]
MPCDYDFGELWIYRTAAVHYNILVVTLRILYETSLSILLKLRKISQAHDVHFQWIPSHVNIGRNEVADRLSKEGSENKTVTGLVTY